MRLVTILALGLGLVAGSAGALAQDVRTQAVRFAPGASSAVVRGSIVGDQSVNYTIGAEAGQTLKVAIKPPAGKAQFNVYAPGRGPGDEALAIGDMLDPPNTWQGVLPASGTYTVSVFMNRAFARRKARASYTLTVAIPSAAALQPGPVRNDVADGLQGGPDTWVVRDVPAGDVLHLRRGPSAREVSLGTRGNGAELRNLGCRMVGAQRWCQVETTDGAPVRGWTNGRYLAEGGGVPAAGGKDFAADCRRYAAVDFATRPENIRTTGTRPGPEGPLVDATANLGAQGVKPFACRFNPAGVYLGVMSKVNEGSL